MRKSIFGGVAAAGLVFSTAAEADRAILTVVDFAYSNPQLSYPQQNGVANFMAEIVVPNEKACIGVGEGAASIGGRSVSLTCLSDAGEYKNFRCMNNESRNIEQRSVVCIPIPSQQPQ